MLVICLKGDKYHDFNAMLGGAPIPDYEGKETLVLLISLDGMLLMGCVADYSLAVYCPAVYHYQMEREGLCVMLNVFLQTQSKVPSRDSNPDLSVRSETLNH